MEEVISSSAPKAIGPYSQAVKSNGLIFCSGQIPLMPDGVLVAGGIDEQVTQVMDNLSAVLKAAGSDFSNVVKTTIFLADMEDFSSVNKILHCVWAGGGWGWGLGGATAPPDIF